MCPGVCRVSRPPPVFQCFIFDCRRVLSCIFIISHVPYIIGQLDSRCLMYWFVCYCHSTYYYIICRWGWDRAMLFVYICVVFTSRPGFWPIFVKKMPLLCNENLSFSDASCDPRFGLLCLSWGLYRFPLVFVWLRLVVLTVCPWIRCRTSLSSSR